MAFSSALISLLLISTSALVLATTTTPTPAPAPAPSHHHHHHHPRPRPHPPTPPPAHPSPPPHTPAPSPTPTPTPTPTPARKYVAVQGVVYCKSCKYRGVDTLMGAAPLVGSVVKLQCNNTKQGLMEQTKTDHNGYFFFMPQKLTTSGVHKCKVFLVSSPLSTCSVATDLHGGVSGALLTAPNSPHDESKPKPKPLPFVLYTVGPFAFEPTKDCHAAMAPSN